jgi:hypothetical protein
MAYTPFNYDTYNYNPDADGMIGNMDFGGLGLHECIQEIKDNSDDACSSNNRIYLLSVDDNTTVLNQLIFMDDGHGMDPGKLADAVVMAKKHIHANGDIGKFGMGLKNASMALGDSIVIITKTRDGSSRGLYMDLAQMRRDNTFKPTQIQNGAENFKALIGRDSVFDTFMNQASGVLISITNIKMDIPNVKMEASALRNSLDLAYKTNIGKTAIYTSTSQNETPLCVNEVDVFYKKCPDALDYRSDTTLRVYLNNNTKELKVFEELKGERSMICTGIGCKTVKGSLENPIYYRVNYESTMSKSGKIKSKTIHKEVKSSELPEGKWYPITIRFISLKRDVYERENKDDKFNGVPNRRRGLWFYRDNRCVGKCITLGKPLDDWSNRTRVEVTYPPELDYHMGMRIQKQMATITAVSISDAITIIFEQQNKVMIKRRKEEAKVVKQSETGSNVDEDEDEDAGEDADEDAGATPRDNSSAPIQVLDTTSQPDDTLGLSEEREALNMNTYNQETTSSIPPSNTTYVYQDVEQSDSDSSSSYEAPVTLVSSHTRNTSKSEHDVMNALSQLMSSLEKNLETKKESASITTSSQNTELFKAAHLLIAYLSNTQ